MQSLSRAVAQAAVAGEPLPGVFPSLELAGWRLRRAQVAMIAGAPNAGKSLLGFAWVAGMDLPSLIFSADTDQFTTALRAAAMSTGLGMRTLESRVQREGRQVLAELTEGFDNLRFCFDPSPTLDDIDLEVKAFTEVWGAPPEVIMVDNLLNVIADDGDEFRGMRTTMAELHDLARKTGACVIVLHHVTGDYDGDSNPPPRRSLMGKVSQLPELILTLSNTGDALGIACVKNRTGQADATGRRAIWFGLDAERMSLIDPRTVQSGSTTGGSTSEWAVG